MDEERFRTYLRERKISHDAIEASIAIATEFEAFSASRPGAGTSAHGMEKAVHAFSKRMIRDHKNTWDNYVALVRYGRFVGSDAILVAALELIDGAEALENLYARLAERAGVDVRNRVFEGIALPPLGTPNADKPALTEVVLRRLEETMGHATCVDLLKDSLRSLEDGWFLDAKRAYEEEGGIDAYLARKGRDFVVELTKHRDEGTLYFSQPVNDEVIAFVEAHPQIKAGVRKGNVLIETKIPHQAIKYLAASSPQEKAYHYCHCPWAKESLRDGPSKISPTFCHCSAGFHKKPYEVIFGRNLKADVLETVLAGDPWCTFAIHLPEEVAG